MASASFSSFLIFFTSNFTPVAALGQLLLVVKPKESGESKNKDDETDGDADDDVVVRADLRICSIAKDPGRTQSMLKPTIKDFYHRNI